MLTPNGGVANTATTFSRVRVHFDARANDQMADESNAENKRSPAQPTFHSSVFPLFVAFLFSFEL